MLVTRISLRTLRLLPTLSNNFARKKDKKDNEVITTGVIKTYMFLGSESVEEKGSSNEQAKEKE